MTDQTAVTFSNGSTSFTGEAVSLFRVMQIKSSIRLHRDTGMIPTRGVTITRMLTMAGEITGKKYKRGHHDAAINDLTVWIEAAKASMPIVDNRH